MNKWFEVAVTINKTYAVNADTREQALELIKDDVMGLEFDVVDCSEEITDENSVRNIQLCADERI